jgi:alanine-glyoxylate transaminase/serine-glyoxylate transaminase/serine-pyruvate transaminase
MESMARRAGGTVVHVDAPWGRPLDPDDVRAALAEYRPSVFGFVHAETSTGVLQPEVAILAEMAHEHGAVVIVDAVTSLGGVELEAGAWDVDVVYSGAQKCLSCPPGASPLTLTDEVFERIRERPEPARSWYLDVGLLEGYWGSERSYHHTAPITNIYALREALRLVAEEGIEERWSRHRHVAGGLVAGVRAMGLEMLPEEEWWLPSLNAVTVPDGVDAKRVTRRMLDEHGIEIAGGLGDLAGRIFRIGCMGHACRPWNVLRVIAALGDTLRAEGADVDVGAGLAAAEETLR